MTRRAVLTGRRERLQMTIPPWDQVRQRCLQSEVGKRLPDALYVHRSALGRLDGLLQEVEALGRALASAGLVAQQRAGVALKAEAPVKSSEKQTFEQFTLIKFHLRQPALSYLDYPEFDRDPHPALRQSLQIQLKMATVQIRQYGGSGNPPILHRKETFVSPQYPLYDRFVWLTQQEEACGLLAEAQKIGTLKAWQQRLSQLGLEIQGQGLACPIDYAPQTSPPSETARTPARTPAQMPTKPPAPTPVKPPVKPPVKNQSRPLAPLTQPPDPSPSCASASQAGEAPEIQRHRAAIFRSNLSRPLRLAVEAGLLSPGCQVFDYGCGRGGDVERLREMGYGVAGWDPYYQPDVPPRAAEIVNLGYVINVIENEAERREALVKAWALTQNVLIVAAQVVLEDARHGSIAYGDGVITQRNTFQKYYEQEELKHYIDQVLGVDAIPLGLGIYAVFRQPQQAEQFRVRRFRSRSKAPRIRASVRRFEAFRELLQPLMTFYSDRGRLPTLVEVEQSPALQAIQDQFKSLKQAFKVVLQATNAQDWQDVEEQRRQDWLVYLALANFGTRPRFKDLDLASQGDIKGLFGNYREACDRADFMLLSVGNLEHIHQSCRQYHQSTGLGQLHRDSLWIHGDLLDSLPPLLRLYEGCGARTLGRFEAGNLLRLHWDQAAVTYYEVPDLETDPHPMVKAAMKLDFRSARLRYQTYDLEDNPPVLVRKEQLIAPDSPHYAKFLKLSQQEYTWGVLEQWTEIPQLWRQKALEAQLQRQCAQLQGHRLVWRKDVEDYQRKLLLSQQRSRKLPTASTPPQSE